MKSNILLFTFFATVFQIQAQIDPYLPDPNPPAVLPGYTLVWSDEFNYTGKPLSSNWSYETGFVRNNEHQWYQADNANVKDGALQIEGRRQTFKNPNYVAGSSDWKTNREYVQFTSASIHARGKKSFRYGRWEIRAKIPAVTGAWPAIWTLGDWGEWPTNGEIDIMEYYGDGILANAAWGSTTRWQGVWDSSKTPMSYFKAKDSNWANKYHVWVMDWTPEFIKIYLDGELLNTIETAKTRNADGSNPFTSRNHYPLLNLALGGNNGGDPNSPNYPITYYVDYIRVYQLDPNYSNCFMPLNAAANLAPDPECNNASPAGTGARVRSRDLMRVYCGLYSAQITGGTYSQPIAWTPGKSYRVRAMIYANGDDVVLGANGLGESNDVEYLVQQPYKSWQQIDFVFTAPPEAGNSGGIFFSGAAGSLIDNIEVYEVADAFLQVSRTQLHFDLGKTRKQFRVTGANLTEDLVLTAPQGITLDKTTLTKEEVAKGAIITAQFDGVTAISNKYILISNPQFARLLYIKSTLQPSDANLIGNWAGRGLTGAGSEPNKFGWIANGSVTWSTANAIANVRYTDQTTSGNYRLNGAPWAGRVLHIRWDSGVSPGNSYSYPVELKAGRNYTLKGLIGWQANGGTYGIYSVGINSQPDNKGLSYMSYHKTIHQNDKWKLYDFNQLFSVPADGTYYVTFDNSGGIMGAVAELDLREGVNLPAELAAIPNTLHFNNDNRVRPFALQGKFLKEDMVITLPEGVTINRADVTADALNAGLVVIQATFDGTRSFQNELMTFSNEEISVSLVVSAEQFATSVPALKEQSNSLTARFMGNELMLTMELTAGGQYHFEIFTLQGVRVHQHTAQLDAGKQTLSLPLQVAPGQYLLRMMNGDVVKVTKVIR